MYMKAKIYADYAYDDDDDDDLFCTGSVNVEGHSEQKFNLIMTSLPFDRTSVSLDRTSAPCNRSNYVPLYRKFCLF